MKTYVVGLMFNGDCSEIVLIKKIKPAWQKGYYNGVGGKIEKDETPLEAMAREFSEEAGVKTFPSTADWKHFVSLTSNDHIIYFYYLIDEHEQYFPYVKTTAPQEGTIHKIPVKDLYSYKIMDNLKAFIPLALHEEITKPVHVFATTVEHF